MPASIATTDTFTDKVLNSDKPVLVDFWAEWCGPCKQIAPIINQISDEYPALRVTKLNIDDHPEIAANYGITSIPTLIVFKNGEPVASIIGAKPKHQLLNEIKEYLY